tara:strand:+ start:72 stop:281 length:210 start_codon:yes stop_codon:yes gene_type:complete
MRVLVFAFLFLFLGAMFIVTENKLALVNPDDFQEFSSVYMGWFDSVYVNLQSLTGEVVRMEWFTSGTSS